MAQLESRGRVQRRPQCGRHRRLSGFLPLVEAFGVDVQGAGSRLGRAALRGQPQGLGAEGRVVRAAVVGFRSVFHDKGKIPPYFVQVYPTTSDSVSRSWAVKIKTSHCPFYLDRLSTKHIVGWQVRADMPEALVTSALQRALLAQRPAPGLIVHSDRGRTR